MSERYWLAEIGGEECLFARYDDPAGERFYTTANEYAYKRSDLSNMRPVQVVAPGQVAVDTADLAIVAELPAVRPTPIGHKFRAALAAASPAPDTEQVERPMPWDEPERLAFYGITPAASGGGTEADGDEGETPSCGHPSSAGPCVLPDGHTDLHSPPWEPGERSRDGQVCDECGHVRLVHVHAREECTGIDCACAEFEYTPAAEPQRVTLPDTPHTKIRIKTTADLSEEWVWFTDDQPGVWFEQGDDGAWEAIDLQSHENEVVSFTILAQPPKADAAETDAPHGPTLHAVERAFTEAGVGRWLNWRKLRSAIEREAGGDGHE